MLEKGNIYDIEIVDISTSGEGIGRAEGVVVFIPGAVPGDIARTEIAEVKKNSAKGRVLDFVSKSDDRVEPRCRYFGRCGGCTMQNMTYESQLRLKEKQLRDKLDRLYGGEAPVPEPIIGAKDPWRYRNNAQYAVYAGKAIVGKDDSVRNSERPRVGFYDGHSRNIVECEECMIQAEPADMAAAALREYIKQSGISIYDEKKRKGRLRQMNVRTGFSTREVMVSLIINGKKIPQKDLLIELMFNAIDSLNDGVVALLEEAAAREGFGSIYDAEGELDYDIIDELEYQENWYELKSLVIIHNSNRTLKEPSTDIEVIYGSKTIIDEAAGLVFEISPTSFYQVNPAQMEKLYETVLEFAELTGDEVVFDLYCGVGTIGLYCAQNARYVWGIESVKSAIIDANRNAVINGLVNIQFINGKAEEKIIPLIEKVREQRASESSEGAAAESGVGAAAENDEDVAVESGVSADASVESSEGAAVENAQPADVIIMDPPRAGCKSELLDAVLEAAPSKIIYVSCDPGTLMRDLKHLTANDRYSISRIRQVDQFCHTGHVETVVLMSRKGK